MSHTENASVELLPYERVALTVALARLARGAEPLPNVTAACVLALARITGTAAPFDYRPGELVGELLTDEQQDKQP